MRDLSVELKVGLVVIVAALILFFGIVWVKDYKFNVRRYEYSVLFPNIGTLEVGDPVSVLGVKKGQVRKIVLSGNDVLVTINLTDDVDLRDDARFTVMNIGLMGERFINIIPGVSSVHLDLSYSVHGFYDTGIPEVMGMMGAAIDEVRHLVAILEGTVGTPAATTSIKNIIANMERISSDLRMLTEENKEKMSQTLEDLSVSSGRMRSFVDRNEQKLQGTLDNFNEASGNFAAISGRMDSLSMSVQNLIAEMEAGRGTLGKMLKEDSLYQGLLKTAADLDSLLTDFKANPKKYIHFSIF